MRNIENLPLFFNIMHERLIINRRSHILPLNVLKLSFGYGTHKNAYISEI